MATHEPPAALFEKQIESIRRQSHSRFVCFISDDGSSPEAWRRIQRAVADDERFFASTRPARSGFYSNFERVLGMVPPDAAYVALADQDDEWHQNKLDVLIRTIEARGAELAYSDMTIVDARGAILRGSYWVGRRNDATDLASLLLMNTVTGAASLFRRAVLDDALPFPSAPGRVYHDHWIACVALARGEIEYADVPLYRYVQHDGNAAGAFVAAPDYRGGVVYALWRFIRAPRARLRNSIEHAGDYVDEAMRVEVFARTLELRLGDRLDRRKRTVLRRASRLRSPGSVLWLLSRSARDLRGRSATLGVELQLLKGIVLQRRRRPRRRTIRS
jgi:glycosyltransferase involved in cell wall biosynthesis